MIVTPEEKEEFKLAEICYICKNLRNGMYHPFSTKDPKCRDHDHIKGN